MDRNSLTKNIGINIRRIRLQMDLSQESLALSAGMHPAYLGRLERGEKCPTIDTLCKISNALGIPVYKLLDFNDKKENVNYALYKIEKTIRPLTFEQQDKIADIVEDIVKVIS